MPAQRKQNKRSTRTGSNEPSPDTKLDGPQTKSRMADRSLWDANRRVTQIVLLLTTVVLLSVIFAPISFWPAAFVCLVPWVVVVGGVAQASRVYWFSYFMALLFFLLNVRWLYPATGWGYLALSVYLAAYFPFVAIALRHVIRRRRWPLAFLLPIIWTGSEMLRAVLISGFPWFFLSHSFHRALWFIQISDLVGAYGVTFVVCAVNGALADGLLRRLSPLDQVTFGPSRRVARRGGVFALILLALTVGYGQFQLHRDTVSVGPKIAVIQGDFVSSIGPGPTSGIVGWTKGLFDRLFVNPARAHDQYNEWDKRDQYLTLARAASSQQPDLYLFPETPWFMFLNPEERDFYEFCRKSFDLLRHLAMDDGSYVVTGSATRIRTPHDLVIKDRLFNSATIFSPTGEEPLRYNKVHLVLFGEYVPFRVGRLRFLYFWLNSLMPFRGPDGSDEYSAIHGDSFLRFAMQPKSVDRTFRYAVAICYEDVMPYVARAFVSGGARTKQIDFLLNISNDGWFGRGVQQPQHLAICVFRAVENRVGIARAVNTGVSGFIDPNGRVHHLVPDDSKGTWPGACGFSVAHIGVDSRFSIYSRWGDWFAWSCSFLWLVVFLDYWMHRARERGEPS